MASIITSLSKKFYIKIQELEFKSFISVISN